MNFALLGDAPEIIPLVRAISAASDHALTAICCTAGLQDALGEVGSELKHYASIETLVRDASFDALIVAGENSEAMDAAKQVAEAGQSVLVLPSPGQDLGVIYELSLMQADAPIALFPIWPLRVHPLVVKLRKMLDEGELGPVQYLELEREITPTATAAPLRWLTSEDIDRAFLADVDLLRDLGGDYNHVTSLRTGDEEQIASATTTLSSPQSPQATWTVKAGAEAKWKLTVAGMRATAVLTGDPAASVLTLEIDGPELSLPEETAGNDWGSPMLEAFLTSTAGESGQAVWDDLQRGFEIMHATHRSLRRKRTVELFFEAHSERSNFKTQMTAAGCCLIMLTLFGMILVLVGGQMGLSPMLMKIARFILFAPLGVFLLLQFLLLLAKPAGGR